MSLSDHFICRVRPLGYQFTGVWVDLRTNLAMWQTENIIKLEDYEHFEIQFILHQLQFA
jgi:hypothetical protein